MKYAYLFVLFLMFVCTAYKAQNSMARDRADFSGKWKLNESKSELGQFGVGDKVCLDWLAASKTMKVAGHANFLTVDLPSSSRGGALVTRREKLIFDGKESDITFLGSIRKKSAVRWSDDGETMTVNSVLYYTNTEIKVIEVWKLINDGKSISIQSNSNSTFGKNSMDLVYDKAN